MATRSGTVQNSALVFNRGKKLRFPIGVQPVKQISADTKASSQSFEKKLLKSLQNVSSTFRDVVLNNVAKKTQGTNTSETGEDSATGDPVTQVHAKGGSTDAGLEGLDSGMYHYDEEGLREYFDSMVGEGDVDIGSESNHLTDRGGWLLSGSTLYRTNLHSSGSMGPPRTGHVGSYSRGHTADPNPIADDYHSESSFESSIAYTQEGTVSSVGRVGDRPPIFNTSQTFNHNNKRQPLVQTQIRGNESPIDLVSDSEPSETSSSGPVLIAHRTNRYNELAGRSRRRTSSSSRRGRTSSSSSSVRVVGHHIPARTRQGTIYNKGIY